MLQPRSSWQVTRSVWLALFMREALARTMSDRMAWFWMLLEPIAMVMIMVMIRSVIMGGGRVVTNAEFIPWMIVGMLGFFLFRENMVRSMGAIEANRSLFAYRQVKPIDPVIIRCVLEGLLKSLILLLFIAAGVLLEIDMLPDQPLMAVHAWLALWVLGLGVGLVVSALGNLVPELGKVIRMLSMPLLLISGVILPLRMLPHELQGWLMLNPIAHGLELLRQGFFELYPVVHGTSMLYVWQCALVLIFLGLLLQLRFEQKLKAQ